MSIESVLKYDLFIGTLVFGLGLRLDHSYQELHKNRPRVTRHEFPVGT